MDGKAPPLREWIGLPPGYIENYQIDKMHVVRHVRTEWQANWKTGVDAFYETYHLPHIHPQTQGVMEDFSQYDAYPNGFQRMIVPICTPSHRIHDRENVNEGLQYMMIEAGMDPAEFKGTAMEVRVAVQKAKRERAKRLGLDHYDKFTDGQLTDSWATGYFPNVQIGMHPEGVFIMRFQPHPTDPERFFYDNMTMVRYVDDPKYSVPGWMGLPKDTDVTGATRPNIEHHFVGGERADLGDVLNQDVDLVEAVQRGQKSRGFRGPLWASRNRASATTSARSTATSTARSERDAATTTTSSSGRRANRTRRPSSSMPSSPSRAPTIRSTFTRTRRRRATPCSARSSRRASTRWRCGASSITRSAATSPGSAASPGKT